MCAVIISFLCKQSAVSDINRFGRKVEQKVGQTKEMVKNRSMFLLALHVLVMVSMFLLAFSGGMRKIDDAVVRFCIELAGYTEKVDIVAIKEQ